MKRAGISKDLPVAPIVVSLLVGVLAVSADSLWIDEGLTAMKANAPSVTEMWDRLWAEGNTNLHMMLYMLCIWAWEKVFGDSEWALRAMNIPFFVLGVTALWSAAEKPLRLPLLIVLSASPFMWFYLNEARTYSMLFAFSAVLTAGTIRAPSLLQSMEFLPRRWIWGMCLAASAMVWTHIVGIIFEMAILLMLMATVGWKPLLQCFKRAPLAICTTFILHAALAAYILWTQGQGVEANAIGKTSLLNVAFWGYEFFGFQGLGPPRNALRGFSIQTFIPYLPFLLLLGISWIVTLGIGLQRVRADKRPNLLKLAAILIVFPLILFLVLGYVKEIRFLPRYAATSFPSMALVVATLGMAAWNSGGIRRLAPTLLILLLALSCLNLRFGGDHARDDYRSAARIAKLAASQSLSVLWAADRETGQYYGLSFEAGGPIIHSDDFDVKLDPLPTTILLSKPDIYDSNGIIVNRAETEGFTKANGPVSFVSFRRAEVTQPIAK